VYVWKI
jgi:hypothetical protein